MVNLRLSETAEKMGGKILQGSHSLSFHKFNIDSRLTEPGELFFALVAERNGHDFIQEAVKKGASGAVISHKITIPDKDIALIQVNDTLEALHKLAGQVLIDHPVKVIGITGSIGKTTAKEFTWRLLSRNLNVLKSEGNFNNQLGVPLSLLKLTDKHEVAVLEMAMSAPGEIRTLTRIAPPDIAVITNIQPVHLQFFNSIDEIALAKKEILEGAKDDGIAVLNGDDSLVRKIAEDWKGRKVLFGLSEECEVRAQNIQKAGWEGMAFELRYGDREEKISLPFFYESHLYNFLAAAAAAKALSVPFDDILPQIITLKLMPNRGTLVRLAKNIRLIDDSYNSNPAALESALKALTPLPSKRKIAVLGDMLELGEKEVEYHIQAGRQVAESGWDVLVTVGALSQHMAEGALSSGMKADQIFSFKNSEEAAEEILILLQEGDLVLVKSSRKIEIEKIVEKLKKERQ
ncbi:MAG: UDP-N-acetylmuramoyl-tripeptide--D-alanyl-D-alanine ligase [Candidatus Aminicenantes bacterium]|nr:UDP-N-acetylmuramoyl-tripeptide--D-alanyl-D-alanine ligase [Candidatus Aminicenantes bacterium]